MAKEYAKEKCKDYGWSDGDYENLVSLWERESGWSVTAGNTEKAYGIPQACPGKKMATFGQDWKTNYKTQINWGLSYISGRYTNPTKAWEHFRKNNWY
jgi:hypothetical protein